MSQPHPHCVCCSAWGSPNAPARLSPGSQAITSAQAVSATQTSSIQDSVGEFQGSLLLLSWACWKTWVSLPPEPPLLSLPSCPMAQVPGVPVGAVGRRAAWEPRGHKGLNRHSVQAGAGGLRSAQDCFKFRVGGSVGSWGIHSLCQRQGNPFQNKTQNYP